jgi:hypothetical protein
MGTVKSKILIITLEPIGESMAGPAIRALEIGKRLASEFEVTVYSSAAGTRPKNLPANVRLVQGGGKRVLAELALGHTAIFIQANVLKPFPFLANMGKHLIVDLYDPYLFAVLVQYKNDPVQASASYRLMHQVLELHMTRADFTVCARRDSATTGLAAFVRLVASRLRCTDWTPVCAN